MKVNHRGVMLISLQRQLRISNFAQDSLGQWVLDLDDSVGSSLECLARLNRQVFWVDLAVAFTLCPDRVEQLRFPRLDLKVGVLHLAQQGVFLHDFEIALVFVVKAQVVLLVEGVDDAAPLRRVEHNLALRGLDDRVSKPGRVRGAPRFLAQKVAESAPNLYNLGDLSAAGQRTLENFHFGGVDARRQI